MGYHIREITKGEFGTMATPTNMNVIDTPPRRDVMLNNVEVGSYGIRRALDGKQYAYGTEIAEPRSTAALEVAV